MLFTDVLSELRLPRLTDVAETYAPKGSRCSIILKKPSGERCVKLPPSMSQSGPNGKRVMVVLVRLSRFG